MPAVANQVDVVGSDAGLERAVSATVRRVEALLHTLHSAANEERRIVVLWNDIAVVDEREAELLEGAPDYIKKAECRVISLSSLVRVAVVTIS